MHGNRMRVERGEGMSMGSVMLVVSSSSLVMISTARLRLDEDATCRPGVVLFMLASLGFKFFLVVALWRSFVFFTKSASSWSVIAKYLLGKINK